MITPKDRIKAFLHWKKLEKDRDEDNVLMWNDIESILNNNDKLLSLLTAVKEYKQAKFKDENVVTTWARVEKILGEL